MLQLVGLDIHCKDGRRRLLVAEDGGRHEWIEGGKELEKVYYRFLEINCSMAELRAGIALVKQGTPAAGAFAVIAAR